MTLTNRTYKDFETGIVHSLLQDDETGRQILSVNGNSINSFFAAQISTVQLKVRNDAEGYIKTVEIPRGTFYAVKSGEKITKTKHIYS